MTSLLFLAADTSSSSGSGSLFGSPFVMIGILFVMMWVLMIRPQQKQRKAQEAKVNAIRKGDRVVTIGGMHSVVHHVSDKTVTLKIAEGIFVPFDKASIRDVTKKSAGSDSAPTDETEDDSSEEQSK